MDTMEFEKKLAALPEEEPDEIAKAHGIRGGNCQRWCHDTLKRYDPIR